MLRGGYGIFYDLGLTTLGGTRLDFAFGAVPGYVGDYYDNARFGVPDDLPVMSLDDIFPPPATVTVGTYPISTGPGTGYFDYPADVRYLDQQSRSTPYCRPSRLRPASAGRPARSSSSIRPPLGLCRMPCWPTSITSHPTSRS